MIEIDNIKTIEDKARFYAEELWGLDFDLPIETNKKYKKRLGCLKYNYTNKKPEKIILSYDLLDGSYNELTMDDTLVHELCHWYCFIIGKQNRDKSKDFEDELKRVGASTSGIKPSVGTFYMGKCSKCGENIIKKNSKRQLQKYLNTNCYISRCCHSQIIYSGIEEIKDTYEVSEKIKELNKKFKESMINN